MKISGHATRTRLRAGTDFGVQARSRYPKEKGEGHESKKKELAKGMVSLG
jgi:hypothetical protein